jgi:hypothetical protein
VLTIVKLFISITSTLLALELATKHTIHWDALKYLLGQEYGTTFFPVLLFTMNMNSFDFVLDFDCKQK